MRIRSLVVAAAWSMLLAALTLAAGFPGPAAAAGFPETVTTDTVDPDGSQVVVAMDVVPLTVRGWRERPRRTDAAGAAHSTAPPAPEPG